jgi:hypothetical protein
VAWAKDPVLEKKVVLLNGQKMITLGVWPRYYLKECPKPF